MSWEHCSFTTGTAVHGHGAEQEEQEVLADAVSSLRVGCRGLASRTGLFDLSLSFCTVFSNQWSCCCKRLYRPTPIFKHIQLEDHGSKSTLLMFQPFVFYIPVHSLKTDVGTMHFFPPTSSYSTLQFPHDRTAVWQLLAFFLVWESLESCFLTQRATHRDIQGSPNAKPASSPALPVSQSFSFRPHFPVLPCDLCLLQQLWSQQWGCLMRRCRWQGRSLQPAWEMAAEARTFVGDFSWRQFEAHLWACLVLLAVGSGPRLVWKRDQSEKTADPVLCSLSYMMANCQLLITFQHFSFNVNTSVN